MTAIIGEILSSLGISRTYYGYAQVIYAIELVLEDETRLYNITKKVYWEVADAFGCKHADVERNIRTIISKAWKKNGAYLCEIAGYELYVSPTVSEFIDMLSVYVQRRYIQLP